MRERERERGNERKREREGGEREKERERERERNSTLPLDWPPRSIFRDLAPKRMCTRIDIYVY